MAEVTREVRMIEIHRRLKDAQYGYATINSNIYSEDVKFLLEEIDRLLNAKRGKSEKDTGTTR